MSALKQTFPRGPLRRRNPPLIFDDAVEVWKRHYLRESQHHIAKAFGIYQGRINEILEGRRHVGSRIVALGKTPLATTQKATH